MKHSHFQSWRRKGAAILLALCGVVFLSGAVPVYAATETETSTSTNAPVLLASTHTIPGQEHLSDATADIKQQQAIKDLQQKFNIPEDVAKFLINFIVMITIILKMLYALLVPIAGMIGKFMSNDWVTGTVFKLDILIETIWQFIRNIVNIVIVLYLIFVAARNVVPYGNESQYDLKQVLPKVALALVVVNFSLFFCRTVLSIANVTTTMAFSIPSQIGGSVFGGFNVVPLIDDNGELQKQALEVTEQEFDKILAEDRPEGDFGGDYSSFKYVWVKPGTTTPITSIPFNPFVWSEPLGQTERANLSTGCKSPFVPDIQTFTQANGTRVSTSYCVRKENNAVVERLPLNTVGGTETVYAMECLHKNYAFNFSESLFSNSGPTLIANPGFDPASGKYVLQPNHYKRILIQSEYKRAQDDQLFADKWNIVYANKQAEVLAQALGAKSAEAGAAEGQVSFPYYQDCVTSLDELAFSARNAMYVYAFNLLHIPSYEKSFTEIQSYADVTVRILMSFFFLLMFFGVTVAMLIAMIGRTFYLWFMMALSPLWVLTDVLKIWKGDDVDQEGAIGGYGKFLALAFLPTLLGVILSIGFMMYHFLSYVGGLEGSQRGRFNVGSISLWFDPGEAVGGVGDLFATMFGLFALAALWIAVFAAFKFGFKSIKLVSTVLDKFDKGAKSVATLAARTPLEMPLLPVGKGGQKISFSALSQLPGAMRRDVEGKRQAKNLRMIESMGLNVQTLNDGARADLQSRLSSNAPDLTALKSSLESPNNRDTREVKRLKDEMAKLIIAENGQLRNPSTLRQQTVRSEGRDYSISKEMQLEMHKKWAALPPSDVQAVSTRLYHSEEVQRAMNENDFTNGGYVDYATHRDKLYNAFSPDAAAGAVKREVVFDRGRNRLRIMNGATENSIDPPRGAALAATAEGLTESSWLVDHLKKVAPLAKKAGLTPTQVSGPLIEQLKVVDPKITNGAIFAPEAAGGPKRSIEDLLRKYGLS